VTFLKDLLGWVGFGLLVVIAALQRFINFSSKKYISPLAAHPLPFFSFHLSPLSFELSAIFTVRLLPFFHWVGFELWVFIAAPLRFIYFSLEKYI